MKIVIDLGDTKADAPQVLRRLDQRYLELTDGRWHIGVRIAGILDSIAPGDEDPYVIIPLEA